MHKLFIVAAFIFALAACSKKETKPGVTLNTTGIEDASFKISYTSLDSVLAESQLVDGKAQVDFKLAYPQLIAIEIEGVEIQHLPFYKLATQFGDLDKSKDYLLYCDQGVMSKLQALYLAGAGFTNVKVYRP